MKNSDREAVVTIGTFDGVHRGHQEIVRRTCELARSAGWRSAAITFDVPPRVFFFPAQEPSLLTTVPEKKFLLKKHGIDRSHVLHFDARLAQVRAEDFFERIVLGECRARAVIVGFNFGFGKNREGDTRFLESQCRARGIPLTVVPPVCEGNVPVSSGRIRDLLREGKVEQANLLLGDAYSVMGEVKRGEGLGRRLGTPTANLEVPPEKILPQGVFAVRASAVSPSGLAGRAYGGVCNVGFRPTVSSGAGRTVEVHLFSFSGNLYGSALKVDFARRLREEKKFPSVDALKDQLAKDKSAAAEALRRIA